MTNDCVEFDGCRLPTGHGQKRFAGRNWLTHRLSWFWFTGEDPGKLCVCHKCDNPPCYNPEHLFLGTKKQNSEDMVAKGRSAKGDRSGMSKLSHEQVVWIRQNKETHTQASMAKACGVSQSAISLILNGRRRQ